MTPVLSFSFLVLLGGVASFQDWRERKIRNRLILAGLGFAGAVTSALLINSLLGRGHLRLWSLGEFYLPLRFYPRLALHLLASLAAGLALWRMSVWPAGDAKLFTLLAFLTALVDPNLPGFPNFLFLLLLINIFVPAGLVFAVETIAKALLRLRELSGVDWRLWPKAKLSAVRLRLRDLWPHRYSYLVLAVNFVALFLGLQAFQARFFRWIGEPLRTLMIFLFAFLAWRGLANLLRNPTVGRVIFVALSAGAAAGALFWGWDVGGSLLRALKMTLNFGMFMSVSRVVFEKFIEKDSLREMRTENLAHGVILADKTWASILEEKELAGKIGERYVDGLSASDAAALKTWLSVRGRGGVAVYHTIPFAFWIFFGTLLTLSGRVNAVAVLAPYFGRARDLLAAAAGRLVG